MPEVAISKKEKGRTPAPRRSSEFFTLPFPFGRSITASPFALMREFTDELDRIFHARGPRFELEEWAPAVDIERLDRSLVVSAELPGLTKDDVKVEVSDDALVLQGERKQERTEEEGGYRHCERRYGRFYRSIPLPEGARPDQVKAELKNGLLKVTVPVAEQARKTRPVPIAA